MSHVFLFFSMVSGHREFIVRLLTSIIWDNWCSNSVRTTDLYLSSPKDLFVFLEARSSLRVLFSVSWHHFVSAFSCAEQVTSDLIWWYSVRWCFCCCSATWVMWWVVPVRKPAWAIYSLCSPELDRLTAGLLAAATAAAGSVFVSPTPAGSNRDRTSLPSMNTLNQRVQDDCLVTRVAAQEGLKGLTLKLWSLYHIANSKMASNIKIS